MKPSDIEAAEASRRADELLRSCGIEPPEPASFSAAMDKMKPEHFAKVRPAPRIHGGALTAIVASVAVVSGSIYLLARHHAKSSQPWTERVDTQENIRQR